MENVKSGWQEIAMIRMRYRLNGSTSMTASGTAGPPG